VKYSLKHRIIGAIIVVSIAVIFLPILLDGGQRPQLAQTTTAIPDAPEKPEIKIKQPFAKDSSEVIGEDMPKRKNWQSGLTDRNTLASWTLQAASFKAEPYALRLRDRLRKAGFRSYVRQKQAFFVVYSGPFTDPNKAKQIKLRLKKEFSISAIMVSYDAMADVRQ